jgi:lipoprotein-anchoring transpeptidase ErfK/SrfK
LLRVIFERRNQDLEQMPFLAMAQAHRPLLILVGLLSLVSPDGLRAAPLQVTAEAINAAELPEGKGRSAPSAAVIARAQVMLDRARFSPGEIDARRGENFDKAVRAFAQAQDQPAGNELTKAVWSKLLEIYSAPAIVEYEITEDDVKGPFVPNLPSQFEELKNLESLSYTSAAEGLAEKFHMSEELLRALNPDKTFDRAGEIILVASVLSGEPAAKVARLEVDKGAQTIRAFDKADRLIAFYPATIGSEEKPSPSGTLKVTLVQNSPTYHYNPKYAFKGVRATEPFTIKPGPNNPVGLVWIGLSQKGYGIHGAPEPSKVSKAESHGCIRLTNWDARHLASTVSKGTPVVFENDPAAGKSKRKSASSRAQAGRSR